MVLDAPKMTYELAVGAAQVVVQKQEEAEAKAAGVPQARLEADLKLQTHHFFESPSPVWLSLSPLEEAEEQAMGWASLLLFVHGEQGAGFRVSNVCLPSSSSSSLF